MDSNTNAKYGGGKGTEKSYPRTRVLKKIQLKFQGEAKRTKNKNLKEGTEFKGQI